MDYVCFLCMIQGLFFFEANELVMPWRNAKKMLSRFHIVRLDDERFSELLHGASLISVSDQFFEVDQSINTKRFQERHRKLVKKYMLLVSPYVLKFEKKQRKIAKAAGEDFIPNFRFWYIHNLAKYYQLNYPHN